jgi:anti-sigma regulatory factor (Ser/Thr protein kinase)
VQFYEHDGALVNVVGEYLAEGIAAEEVAFVIATPPHRSALLVELDRSGIDAARALDQGSLLMLDARATLTELVVDGRPDRGRFDRVIGDLIRRARGAGRGVRAFGEMVALLWDDGLVGAAIELEDLWNELGQDLDFGLLCAYPLASVDGAEHDEGFAHVCRAHAAVVDAEALAPRRLAGLGPTELVQSFDASMTAPTRARALVRGLVPAFADRALAHDAALVTAELATNAVMHARSEFTVTVSIRDRSLRVAVSDASTRMPRLRPLERSSTSGRGLHIVSSLASRWGTEILPRGKVVWADLTASNALTP